MIKTYYRLAKPGIIYGNALTALAGFFLAAKGTIDLTALAGMLLGLSLIIGASCVFNNYLDREIDSKMERTSKRSLVTGEVPVINALIYAVLMLGVGSFLLGALTNLLTLSVALIGAFIYVIVYGYAKRRSPLGTIVGSAAGAVPPVVGYCAFSGKFDRGALLLFLILVFWQMPHFYSIAIYRLKDYKNAGLPVLPLRKGIVQTKKQILTYIVLFTAAAIALGTYGYGSRVYVVFAALLGIYWYWRGFSNFMSADNNRWGRRMFGTSLIVISLWSAAVTIDSFFR